ncbi:MAG TPA: COX15/CtaA family protein [Blastocatellia bacterium]|nr:COX15/CtaA family protein [Blastocatellia bacterium]
MTKSPWGHRLACMTAGMTLLLLIIGGLVTSNEAGDSVPDWPLAFGRLLPLGYLVGNVVYEYTHRVVAASVGVLTLVLNLWLWRREQRPWIRHVGWAALIAVVTQGLLGGVRVLLLEYRVPVAIIHATLAQLFFSLTIVLVEITSARWEALSPQGEGSAKEPSRARALASLSVAALFVQLILGAAYRHKAIGIIPHAVGAGVVSLLLVLAVRSVLRVTRTPSAATLEPTRTLLRRPARWVLGTLLVQVPLGIAAYLARRASIGDPQPMEPMISLTVSHLACGAVLLAATLTLALRLHRVFGAGMEKRELSTAVPRPMTSS